MQACLDDFAAQGVDLTAYNSVENAADIDALRQALGYDKIIYYGESYGTLLGQYLLRAHPEIVDAIILDGIAPATATRWTDVTKIHESFQRVFDACAADEACHAAYPDPEGALAQALATLKANPAPYTLTAGEGITVPLQVDDVLAMNALFINLYIPGGYAQVPAIVYQLSQGDYSALASYAPAVLRQFRHCPGDAHGHRLLRRPDCVAGRGQPGRAGDVQGADPRRRAELRHRLPHDRRAAHGGQLGRAGRVGDSRAAASGRPRPGDAGFGRRQRGDRPAQQLQHRRPGRQPHPVPQPVHPGHDGRLHARPAGRAGHELHRPERALRRALCGDRHQPGRQHGNHRDPACHFLPYPGGKNQWSTALPA